MGSLGYIGLPLKLLYGIWTFYKAPITVPTHLKKNVLDEALNSKPLNPKPCQPLPRLHKRGNKPSDGFVPFKRAASAGILPGVVSIIPKHRCKGA